MVFDIPYFLFLLIVKQKIREKEFRPFFFLLMADLIELSDEIWSRISPRLSGSVVYTDDAIIQVLRWGCYGGIGGLLEGGVVNFKSITEYTPREDAITLVDTFIFLLFFLSFFVWFALLLLVFHRFNYC